MNDEDRRGIAFYLFGVRRTTGVLALILVALILLPALVSGLIHRFGPPPEPRKFRLTRVVGASVWLRVDDRRMWVEDFDDDGQVDCLRFVPPTSTALWAPGHEDACRSSGVMNVLLRFGDPRPFTDAEREALSRMYRVKVETRLTETGTDDVDGDGRVDCVESLTGGLVYVRDGAICPGAEYALPDPLEGSPLQAEFQQVYEVEAAARAALGGRPRDPVR